MEQIQAERLRIGFLDRRLDTSADAEGKAADGEDKSLLLESILDAVPEMIVYHDDLLNVVWANQAAADFVGLKREEMFGRRFFEVACRNEEPCEGCPVLKGLRSDWAEVIENSLLVDRLYFTRSYPVVCEGRRIGGRLIVAQDVSNLRNRYGVTDVLNLISEVFHSPRDLTDICKEVIKAVVARFKYPGGLIVLYDENTDEFVNMGEIDFSGKLKTMAGRYPLSQCFSGKALKEGAPVNITGLSRMDEFEGYALKKAGAETVLAAPLDVEGTMIGAVILVDFVERLETNLMIDGLQAVANRLGAEIQRMRAERKLREERNFTAAVLNNAGPLILVMDENGRIVRFNKACERLTGYSYEEVAGSFVWEALVSPGGGEAIRGMFPFTPEKTLPSFFDNVWITKDGQKRLISWSNNIMGDAAGSGAHIVSIGTDITDRRKMEEESELRRRQLVEADKMASLGVLASGVAHEVNNPNNFIMMNAPILRQAWEDVTPILQKYYTEYGEFNLAGIPYSEIRQEAPKLFDGIEEGAKRIMQIVLNMKNYAKRDVLDMDQQVNMRDVIKAALGLLSYQIKQATHCISVDAPGSLPLVKGNFQRLEQVLINLVQNACQALPDRDKKIAISACHEKESGRVVVCVADEGVGIRSEHLEHIFDPFFTTKSDRGGTGLGLSVCAGIVKEHHGRLEFASEWGRGTTVYLSLPVMG